MSSGKIKILLVNSGIKFFQPNLGLGYLAAYVKKHLPEAEFVVADENTCQNPLKIAKAFQPDIVGFTATTSYINAAERWAAAMRRLCPSSLFVLGGVHVTALPEEMSKTFDVGVTGEGEQAFLSVVKNRRDYAGKHCIVQGSFAENLDNIPLPDRSLFDMEYYTTPNQTIRGYYCSATQIMSSRGCPFDCSFCGNDLMWKGHVRFFSAEYLIAELEHLVDTYDVSGIFIQDDIFVINKKRMEKFVEAKNKSNKLRKLIYSAQLRPSATTMEQLRLLKESGCVQVEYGFESGSNPVLKRLKGNSASIENNLHAAEMANSLGLRVLGTFMMGEPEATETDELQTIDFIRKVPLDFGACFLLTPYPGTRLFKRTEGRVKNWDDFNMTKNNSYNLMPRAVPEPRLFELLNQANKILAQKSVVAAQSFSLGNLAEKTIKTIFGPEWEKLIPYKAAFTVKKWQSKLKHFKAAQP